MKKLLTNEMISSLIKEGKILREEFEKRVKKMRGKDTDSEMHKVHKELAILKARVNRLEETLDELRLNHTK